MFLNTTNASYAPNPGIAMYPSATTATTFSLRAGASIATSANCVAYCFNEVDGFSKFGSYTGNGSTDGTFVYTGLRPAWVMIKNISGAYHWNLFDSARDTFNPVDRALAPSSNAVETNFSTSEIFDFLSNGFKLRCTLVEKIYLETHTSIWHLLNIHSLVMD